MDMLEKSQKLLKYSLCDHCIGRQFGQLLSGLTNPERGRIVRHITAMSIDHEKFDTKDFDMSNFADIKFHILETMTTTAKKCHLCNNLFERLGMTADKIKKQSKEYEFRTFLIGTKLSFELLQKEEDLWESVGIDYCEPIKSEINRELGKKMEKLTGVKFDAKAPDMNFIVDFNTGSINIMSNPLFIYGEYQKLKRGIPQTKWPSGAYKTSVEEIIAKPYMKATKGIIHKLHGAGREDIDARCLGWRPFVLEILEPKKRLIDLIKLSKTIEKDVKVRGLRLSNIIEVRRLKEAKNDKTYMAVVECEGIIKKNGIKELKSLIGEICQRTPTRVLHRRADKKRKRHVKEIKCSFLSKRRFKLIAKVEGGLYVKELISGDNGRTAPSVSSILGIPCKCKELDVIKIHT